MVSKRKRTDLPREPYLRKLLVSFHVEPFIWTRAPYVLALAFPLRGRSLGQRMSATFAGSSQGSERHTVVDDPTVSTE